MIIKRQDNGLHIQILEATRLSLRCEESMRACGFGRKLGLRIRRKEKEKAENEDLRISYEGIYVLDANALMRYLSNGIGAEKVDALIRRQAKDGCAFLISVVN